jgi:hypothetical protein
MYIIAGHKGRPDIVRNLNREGRRRRLRGARGRGTLATEKPPVLGLIQRDGDVVINMLPNVQQVTIKPIITQTDADGRAGEPVLHRRVRYLSPLAGMGISAQDRQSLKGRICSRRRRRRLPRGSCQHHGGILVAPTFLAASPSRHFSREAPSLPQLF